VETAVLIMTKKQRALAAVAALKKDYPDAQCSLRTEDPFELLVATILSAQCTDARVNLITPALFRRFPDAPAFASAKQEDVETSSIPADFPRQGKEHHRRGNDARRRVRRRCAGHHRGVDHTARCRA
jgi:3-methyladenine DNA glycosylase/8-oxoguanine DNA glycosylase